MVFWLWTMSPWPCWLKWSCLAARTYDPEKNSSGTLQGAMPLSNFCLWICGNLNCLLWRGLCPLGIQVGCGAYWEDWPAWISCVMTTCSLGNTYHWPVGMVCQGRCGTLQPISSPPITQVWISTKCPLGTFSMLLFLRISDYRWSSMAIRIGGHVISSTVWAPVVVIVVFWSWTMSSWLCWFNYRKVTNKSHGLSLCKPWPSCSYYWRTAFMYTYRIESIDTITDVHLQ